MTTATRYHDFCAGHRVVGQGGKCEHLHGHNYRVYFTVQPEEDLDEVGRVLDFSVIKEKLCEWLEEHWDHKMMLWQFDPLLEGLTPKPGRYIPQLSTLMQGIVKVPFNPTAENMAEYLVEVVGPEVLKGTGCFLRECTVWETRKCYATYKKQLTWAVQASPPAVTPYYNEPEVGPIWDGDVTNMSWA